MPEESKLETYFCQRAKRIGALTYKFTSSVTGVPDRVLMFKGHTYWIELKSKIGVVNERQQFVHDEMKQQDIYVVIMFNKTQIDIFFSMLKIN